MLPVFESFAKRCVNCISLVRTASPQHFARHSAAATASFRNTTPFSSAYPCRPLAEAVTDDTHDARYSNAAGTVDARTEVQQAARACAAHARRDPLHLPPLHAPQDALPECWRSTDLLRTVERLRLRHVLLAYSSRPMEAFWRSHLGNTVKQKHGSAVAITDCTHNCIAPFLFEPLWWAMRTAAQLLHSPTSASRRASARPPDRADVLQVG